MGHVTYFRGAEVDSAVHNGHVPVLYATEALLARKLGLAEPAELGQLRFRAALRARVDGAAVYDNLSAKPIYEAITMLNVLVEVTGAHDSFPISTESYSLIGWTSVEGFIAGVRSRDPAAMGAGFDPIDLCVHGVCLRAAQETLDHVVGRPAFPALDASVPEDDLALRPLGLLDHTAGGQRETMRDR